MIISIELRPPLSVASGKRQARSGGRKPGAACCQRVAVAWVGRSAVRLGNDVLMLGCVIVWGVCSAGVAVSEIVSGLSYHAHARARAAASRRPCDNVYIIARHSPAPGVVFKSFRAFQSPGSVHQLPSHPISLPFLFPSQNQPSLPHTLSNAPLA